jgi:hypothetical protein
MNINDKMVQEIEAISFKDVDPEKLKLAYEYGRKAFLSGRGRPPAQDNNFMKLVTGLKAGEGSEHDGKQFLAGWDYENLKAPVKDASLVDSIERINFKDGEAILHRGWKIVIFEYDHTEHGKVWGVAYIQDPKGQRHPTNDTIPFSSKERAIDYGKREIGKYLG